jgi:ankyrin repeat protein
VALSNKFRGTSRKKGLAGTAFDKGSSKDNMTLADCVANSDAKGLKKLLNGGADPDGTNARGETALMLAAQVGDLEAIRLLIEAGAEMEAKGKFGVTALMFAAQNGDLSAMKLLVEKGADPNAKKRDGTTVLMIASMFGHAPCVEVLIAAGAHLFSKDFYGYTALMFAEDRKCVTALREAEAHAHLLMHEKSDELAALDAIQASLLRKALVNAMAPHKKKKKRHGHRRALPATEPAKSL